MSNLPFLMSDIRALSPEHQSARMSEIKHGWLELDGSEHFEM